MGSKGKTTTYALIMPRFLADVGRTTYHTFHGRLYVDQLIKPSILGGQRVQLGPGGLVIDHT